MIILYAGTYRVYNVIIYYQRWAATHSNNKCKKIKKITEKGMNVKTSIFLLLLEIVKSIKKII